ncbi:MAG: peptidase M61 [Burkholderiaceae bacterium]|jgi:predicted metalloprotease with PDZ domain|nr:peptidase M61 [Burkholderiaceae bacterium]
MSAKTTRRPPGSPAAVHYAVALDLRAHRYCITLSIARPDEAQRLSLPVWIPGSYLVRDFSGQLLRISASQGERALDLRQTGKCDWQAERANPQRPLRVRYEVFARDASVRTAWLDAGRGFFNGASLFLQVHGQQDAPHTLQIDPPPASAAAGWQLATALPPLRTRKNGFGSYRAENYDELVDSPVEMGPFWRGEFVARGVPHSFVVAAAPASFDGARLLADVRRVCEAAIDFWHGGKGKPPHKRYLFLLNTLAEGYGGLEHRHSTALLCARQDLPRQGGAPAGHCAEGYARLLGLISHEYFHTWNVKRLRPLEFARYDYGRENLTPLLWFFEGFTSYYDDLLLRRAGLIDDAAYLRLLGKCINQVLQAPGRKVQSVAQASVDAWVKYYRPDANTPNATISYYSKGALVALCLDLTLRQEGKTTLDEVMRALWRRCRGGPMQEADLLAVLADLAGRPFAPEIRRWVHGTQDLPLQPLLAAHGVRVLQEAAPLTQTLGLRVAQSCAATGSIAIETVLDGSPAWQAGFAPGDEWLGMELPPGAKRAGKSARAQGWRLKTLDELPLYAGAARKIVALVARDRQLLRLPLALPGSPAKVWRLTFDGAAAPATGWPGR